MLRPGGAPARPFGARQRLAWAIASTSSRTTAPIPAPAGHTAKLAPGPWVPGEELPDDVHPVGFMVADGLLSRDLLLGSGVASDLLGPGDLVGFGNDEAAFLPIETKWVVCAPSQVTYLDLSLIEALRQRPEVSSRLVARAAQQATRQAAHRAISQLPRVELRLLALFWLLAERWGRVGTLGIVVPVALTHEALGRMVGARRPTISLALKELDEEGAVHRRGDGSWLLSAESTTRLKTDAAPSAVPAAEALPSALPRARKPRGGRLPPVELPPQLATVRSDDLARRVARLVEEHAVNRERMQAALERSAAARADLSRAQLRREAARR